MIDLLTYADETGTHAGAIYCLVSGFLASPRHWRIFDTAWRKVLEKYEVSEFHSETFFRRPKDPRTSSDKQFAGWDDDKGQRFLTELVENVLMARRLTPVGGAINVSDFNSYTHGQRRYLTMAQITPSGRFVSTGAPNRPYQLGLITLAIDAIQASISDSKVDFILDENSPEEGLAVQTFRYVAEKRVHPDWERLGEIRYADSEAEPGLQAADLYNYVWQRYLVREDEGKSLGREEFYVMGQFGRMRTSIKVWRKSGMDLMLEQLSPEQRQKLKREA